MKYRHFKDSLKAGDSSRTTETDIIERRSSQRKPVIASAQVIELDSGARLRARSCDLVVRGCYIDTLNPFPPGTFVRIRLEKEDATFDAKGKVVYRLPGLGMGIAFLDLTPENQLILEQWLALSGSPEDPFEASLSPVKPEEPKPPSLQPDHHFLDLITLLKRKGVITPAEATSLLKLPLD